MLWYGWHGDEEVSDAVAIFNVSEGRAVSVGKTICRARVATSRYHR